MPLCACVCDATEKPVQKALQKDDGINKAHFSMGWAVQVYLL